MDWKAKWKSFKSHIMCGSGAAPRSGKLPSTSLNVLTMLMNAVTVNTGDISLPLSWHNVTFVCSSVNNALCLPSYAISVICSHLRVSVLCKNDVRSWYYTVKQKEHLTVLRLVCVLVYGRPSEKPWAARLGIESKYKPHLWMVELLGQDQGFSKMCHFQQRCSTLLNVPAVKEIRRPRRSSCSAAIAIASPNVLMIFQALDKHVYKYKMSMSITQAFAFVTLEWK